MGGNKPGEGRERVEIQSGASNVLYLALCLASVLMNVLFT